MQQRTQLAPESGQSGCGVALLIIFGTIFFVVVAGIILAGVAALFTLSATGGHVGLITLAGIIILFGVSAFLISRRVRLRRYLAQHTQPTVVASNHPLRMGERFTVDCTFPPQSETEIVAGSLTLILRESATYETGMGTERRSTTVTYDHKYDACSIPHIAATGNIPYNLTWNSIIPLTAMHTFAATDNKIRWYLVFDMQVRARNRIRKYSTRFPVMVLPQIIGAQHG